MGVLARLCNLSCYLNYFRSDVVCSKDEWKAQLGQNISSNPQFIKILDDDVSCHGCYKHTRYWTMVKRDYS